MKKGKLVVTSEAAKAAGVPRATLQHWIRTGAVRAPAIRLVENRAARLWSAAQIREIGKLKGRLRPGPKGPRKKAKRRRGGSR